MIVMMFRDLHAMKFMHAKMELHILLQNVQACKKQALCHWTAIQQRTGGNVRHVYRITKSLWIQAMPQTGDVKLGRSYEMSYKAST